MYRSEIDPTTRSKSQRMPFAEPQLKQLFSVLDACRKGNFGVRMPNDPLGSKAELVGSLNAYIDRWATTANETQRVAQLAGKQAQEAQLKVGDLQSAIFNSANFSSIATDANGVIQIFNVGAERMLGYTAAEVMNKITPADISDPQEVVARAKSLSLELDSEITPGFEALVFKASRGIEDIYELTYIRKDGSRFPAVVSVTALRDAQDTIIGYLLIGTDNTARKQAEQALLRAGALQSAIFNSANFSSIATDANGVIQIFNVGAERMLGYTAAEVMNKITPADISDPQEVVARAKSLSLELDSEITPGFEALVFKASRGIEDIYELTYIRKDGSRFPAVVSVTALRDAQDTIIGYLLIGTDNTARKQAEADKNKLQQDSRIKSEFLANMSHELRTPLNGIIGFAEFLSDGKPGELNAKQKEYLLDILNSGKHLLHLINDVLDLAKVESGKMKLNPERFTIADAISEACAVAKPMAQKKRIQLSVKVAPELGNVMLDQQKFKQVLYNLISNGVKFTDDGGDVEVSAVPLDAQHFKLLVKDTGIGIKPEDMKRLFHEFEQLESGAARRYEGTGLGLALTRKIVELQGGSISAKSKVDRGSTFSVVLPFVIEPGKS